MVDFWYKYSLSSLPVFQGKYCNNCFLLSNNQKIYSFSSRHGTGAKQLHQITNALYPALTVSGVQKTTGSSISLCGVEVRCQMHLSMFPSTLKRGLARSLPSSASSSFSAHRKLFLFLTTLSTFSSAWKIFHWTFFKTLSLKSLTTVFALLYPS